jgi:5-bromo-4-chloroindolyl phosphate hydrolysis protein
MARRFGGKYSPTPAQPGAPRGGWVEPEPAAAPVGLKASLLFALPLPFLVTAFGDDPGRLFTQLGATGLLILSAWLTREGIRAHAAYEARKIARRPALPRKILAAVLTGAALALATLSWPGSAAYPLLFALFGAGLHLGAFGPDPLRDKGMTGLDPFQTDRVARAVEEAEAQLAAMKDAILRARDAALEARVDRFVAVARALMRSVESDPGDLTAARRYLSVYLTGAREATVKFADLYADNQLDSARADYEALLADLETNFAARTKALLANSHSDLDIEIAVLRDRLKLEG